MGQAEGPQKGLAITSFVLGLLSLTCFSLLAGIPAIICGHVARGRTRLVPRQHGGAGFALAGLIMGYPQDKVATTLKRAAAIWGHSTGPAFTITRGGPVSVLQGLVLDVGVGVGGEAPDSGDVFVHVRRFNRLSVELSCASATLVRMSGNVFRWDYRVGYADCTVGNHVYHSRYLDLLERARGEFFRQIGKPLAGLQQEGTSFPVLECHLQYYAPARYDDLLTIEVSVTAAKGVRINFRHRIFAQSSRCLVEGETLHACTLIEGKPKRLPRELVDLLGPYLPPVDSH